MNIAQQGVLNKVVAGERCIECFKKTQGVASETNFNRCAHCLKSFLKINQENDLNAGNNSTKKSSEKQ